MIRQSFLSFQEVSSDVVKSAEKVVPGPSNGSKRINRDGEKGKEQSPEQGNISDVFIHCFV